MIDLQAAGGLYDAIALEVFPEAIRRQIVGALQPLSATNFCNQIAVGAAPGPHGLPYSPR